MPTRRPPGSRRRSEPGPERSRRIAKAAHIGADVAGDLRSVSRLLNDASHELRTPLAIMKAELDLSLSRARTPKEMDAALRSASEETDRLAGKMTDFTDGPTTFYNLDVIDERS